MIEHAIHEALTQALASQGRFRWGKVSRIDSTVGQPITATVGDGPDAPTMRVAKQSTPLTVGAWVIWWDEPGNSFVLQRLEVGT